MKRWIVKNTAGDTQGPFEEKEICQKIQNLELNGEELISVHDKSLATLWKPISSHTPFYEALLKTSQKGSTASFEKVELKTYSTSRRKRFQKYTSTNLKKSLFSIINRFISRKKKSSVEDLDLGQSDASQTVKGHFKSVRIQGKTKDSVIEMEDSKFVLFKYIIKDFVIPIGFLGGLFYLFVLYFNTPSVQQDQETMDVERVQLLIPRESQPSEDPSKMKEKIEKGLTFYFQSQVSGYIKAQDEFVQTIEGSPRHKLAHTYLCLTYLELWPFTNQRSDDFQAVSTLVERSENIDPSGIYSSLCRAIHLILQEQYDVAKNVIQNSIDIFSQGLKVENLSPFLYYLRGVIRFREFELDLALQDLENAQTLLPEMYNAALLKAQVFERKNQLNQALKVYSSISETYPNHKASLLAHGILQYNYLRQFDQAEKMIRNALDLPELVSPQYLASAYFILAQIALKIKDSEEFFEYGRKAYALNPANTQLEQLLENSGFSTAQQNKIKKVQVKSRLLIEKGDQLEREGDVFKARSYYEQAFIVDQKKNAVAALKMGRSLWESGFSLEAIDWLQKSIYADSQYIRPYILMSEYYSSVYKTEEAAQVLKTAYEKSPNNIDIFKGYANLALKEKAFYLASQYALRALQIYDLDVESHLILSQAYYFLGKYTDSFEVISKARELAVNDRDVHIQYGKVLGKIKGLDTAFEYFEDLIFKTQKGSQNHIQYVLSFSELLLDYGEPKNAIHVLETLSDVEEKPIHYYMLLGKIYAQEDRAIQLAYEEFLKAALINPSDPQVMYQLSLVLMKLRQYDEAESYLNKILKSYKRYPQINYLIAQILFLKGENKDRNKHLRNALKKLDEEIKVNPKFAKAYQLAGDIYEKLGEYTLCARSYQKAIEIFPENSEYSIKSAYCYRKLGEIDLSLQVLRGAIGTQEMVSDPLIYRELGALYEIKKDYGEAVNNYALYIKNLPNAEDRKQIEERINNY